MRRRLPVLVPFLPSHAQPLSAYPHIRRYRRVLKPGPPGFLGHTRPQGRPGGAANNGTILRCNPVDAPPSAVQERAWVDLTDDPKRSDSDLKGPWEDGSVAADTLTRTMRIVLLFLAGAFTSAFTGAFTSAFTSCTTHRVPTRCAESGPSGLSGWAAGVHGGKYQFDPRFSQGAELSSQYSRATARPSSVADQDPPPSDWLEQQITSAESDEPIPITLDAPGVPVTMTFDNDEIVWEPFNVVTVPAAAAEVLVIEPKSGKMRPRGTTAFTVAVKLSPYITVEDAVGTRVVIATEETRRTFSLIKST